MADPTKPEMPDGAPQDVKDFFDCKSDKLVWKKGKVEWLTIKISDDVEVTPDVSFEHGKAGSVQISISLATGVSGTVNASVNADGQLVVGDVSILLRPFKDKIDEAIKKINDWFKHNHKKLKPAVLKKGEVTLEKMATTGAYAPPVVVPGDAENRPQPVNYEPGPDASVPIALASTAVTEPDGAYESQLRGPSTTTWLILAAFAAVVVLGLGIGYALSAKGPGSSVPPTLVAAASQAVSAAPTKAASAAPSQSAQAAASVAPSAVASVPAVQSVPPSQSAAPSQSSIASVAAGGTLLSACIAVKHEELNEFVSFIEIGMAWSDLDVDHFEVTFEGANDNAPGLLVYEKATGMWRGVLGLHEPGDLKIKSVKAVFPSGASIDVTERLIDFLHEDTITVRYPQEDSWGDCAV